MRDQDGAGRAAGRVARADGALVLPFGGVWPRIAPDVFLAPGSVVVGDVEIGADSSVWFQAMIRGDVAPVRIGARSNVQDGAVIHVDANAPCTVGDDVTIGHGASVHGTTVGNGTTIGMGSIVLSRSRIGERAIVAAGAVVAEGSEVRPGALVMGVPARERRLLDQDAQEASAATAGRYVANAKRYRDVLAAAGAGEEGERGG